MSRHTDHSNRRREDASVDSGYGGSTIASPKTRHEDAPRSFHSKNTRHHDKSATRESPSRHRHGLDKKNSQRKQKGSDSDTDYDPRDIYYLDVDDDEYDDMSFRKNEVPSEGSRLSEDRRQHREKDSSGSHARNNRDNYRQKSPSVPRRDPTSSTGNNSGDRHKRYSSKSSDTSSTRGDSRDQRPSRHPRSKASAASHSRHESNYRSLSPIPSEWGDSGHATSSPARPRRASTRRGHRDSPSGKSTKDQDASAGWVDPEGESANSFLQKLTKGIDVKSVGKVGLDAAAVAAIKVAVGTRVPWQQRIPKTIAAGAAAAIMDFVAKKTAFQPKGMVGTIFARQFVEIILANLIISPVTSKLTGTAQKIKGGGKPAIKGTAGGGGGKGRK